MDSSTLLVAQIPQRPQRQWAIFVSKLSPDTTSADLKKHIESVDLSAISCRRLKTKYPSYSSFCVTVDEYTSKRLNDPSRWPCGCIFKPFRGILHEDMLHPSECAPDKRTPLTPCVVYSSPSLEQAEFLHLHVANQNILRILEGIAQGDGKIDGRVMAALSPLPVVAPEPSRSPQTNTSPPTARNPPRENSHCLQL
ncbi:hypothetical protein MTO96_043067 [Rhipicephalus appendiculatus]